MKIHIKKKSPIVQPVIVTLDLSGEEAMLLRSIFNMIGGNPNGDSPRAFTERIAAHLGAEGVSAYDLNAHGDSDNEITLPARWADLIVSEFA